MNGSSQQFMIQNSGDTIFLIRIIGQYLYYSLTSQLSIIEDTENWADVSFSCQNF
jgi:hypothetical protein